MKCSVTEFAMSQPASCVQPNGRRTDKSNSKPAHLSTMPEFPEEDSTRNP